MNDRCVTGPRLHLSQKTSPLNSGETWGISKHLTIWCANLEAAKWIHIS